MFVNTNAGSNGTNLTTVFVTQEVEMATQVSQQEKIRQMYVKGMTRSEITKKLGIRYQIVFKATNVTPRQDGTFYVPKSWLDRLTDAKNGKFVETVKRTRKTKAVKEEETA